MPSIIFLPIEFLSDNLTIIWSNWYGWKVKMSELSWLIITPSPCCPKWSLLLLSTFFKSWLKVAKFSTILGWNVWKAGKIWWNRFEAQKVAKNFLFACQVAKIFEILSWSSHWWNPHLIKEFSFFDNNNDAKINKSIIQSPGLQNNSKLKKREKPILSLGRDIEMNRRYYPHPQFKETFVHILHAV